MTVKRYITRAVRCDSKASPNCHEEYEGLPGLESILVKSHAQSLGWYIRSFIGSTSVDYCPECRQVLGV